MRIKKFYLSFLLMNLSLPLSSWADISSFFNSPSDTTTTVSSNAQTSQNSSNSSVLTNDQIKTEAKRWSLSVEDYSRYLDLMKNTPSGKWYPQSDPAEVLAINARSSAEREKYAEMVAQLTHDRLENELSMQRAFNVAWQKLYPDLKPIAVPNKFQKNNTTSLQSGDQLMLFTGISNVENNFILSQLLSAIQNHSNIKLAIFIIGNDVSDKNIRDWAQQNGIPANLVQQGIIVLDHDKGRFARMTKNSSALPTVILNHRGSFNIVSVNELNE